MHSSCILPPSQSTNQAATDILFPTHTHDPSGSIRISLNPSTKHCSNTNNLFTCRFGSIIIPFHHIEDSQTLSNIVILTSPIIHHHSSSIIIFIIRGQNALQYSPQVIIVAFARNSPSGQLTRSPLSPQINANRLVTTSFEKNQAITRQRP